MWLPPMPTFSPSPVKATTGLSGRAIFTPSAKAIERPCRHLNTSTSRFMPIQAPQPPPDTMPMSPFLIPSSSSARIKALRKMP